MYQNKLSLSTEQTRYVSGTMEDVFFNTTSKGYYFSRKTQMEKTQEDLRAE